MTDVRGDNAPVSTTVPDPDPRFSLANERTFLAWNRTALALIGGGLLASDLLDLGSRLARLAVATPLIVLGAVLALTSYVRWRAVERSIQRHEALTDSRLPTLLTLGVGTIALAVAAIVFLDAL